MAGTVTTPAFAWNFNVNDVVYFIDACSDLQSSTIIQGTVYRIEVTETVAATATVKYILQTSYASSVVIEDESTMFATKAAALVALDALIP